MKYITPILKFLWLISTPVFTLTYLVIHLLFLVGVMLLIIINLVVATLGWIVNYNHPLPYGTVATAVEEIHTRLEKAAKAYYNIWV